MAKVNESAEEVPTRKTVKHMFDPRLVENVNEDASKHSQPQQKQHEQGEGDHRRRLQENRAD